MKPIKHIPNLQQKADYSFKLTLGLYSALLLLFAFWNLNRSEGLNWAVWLFQSLPLLALLPGLLRKYYRSFSWLCFLLLFYFIKAIEGVFMSTATGLDYVFLTLTVLLFVSQSLKTSLFA